MKKILRSKIALALLLLISATSMAAETVSVQYLVLSQEDGTEAKFALTDYPVITFNEGGEMVVTCNGSSMTFDSQQLTKHEIITEEEQREATAIGAVQNDQVVGTTKPQVAFGKAEFSGLKEGQRVLVYTIDGKMVATTSVNANGRVSIDLSSLPKGVYILRAPNYSYKVSTK